MATIDPSTTYQLIEATEAVTYFQRTSTGPLDGGTAIPHAKRRAIGKTDLQGGKLLAELSLTWHLWKADLGSIVPKIGDQVQDAAGISWQVKSVDVQSLANRFRLTTVKVQ